MVVVRTESPNLFALRRATVPGADVRRVRVDRRLAVLTVLWHYVLLRDDPRRTVPCDGAAGTAAAHERRDIAYTTTHFVLVHSRNRETIPVNTRAVTRWINLNKLFEELHWFTDRRVIELHFVVGLGHCGNKSLHTGAYVVYARRGHIERRTGRPRCETRGDDELNRVADVELRHDASPSLHAGGGIRTRRNRRSLDDDAACAP